MDLYNHHKIQAQMLGRLGNQMFIYAFVRRLTLDLGLQANLVIESKFNRLACFELSDDIHFVEKFDYSIRQKIGIFIYQLMTRGNKTINQITELEKKHQSFFQCFNLFYSQEGCLEPSLDYKNVAVLGYFQSEDCFHTYRNSILKEFTFKPSVLQKCQDVKKEIDKAESCCVHIRMGDYMKSEIFGVCGINYYQKAIDMMKQKKRGIKFFVFSDNINDVRSSFDWSDNVTFISEKFTDQESLYLGSQCKHYILSNSSFSWWMQYLSKNQEKLVIAPSRWFNQDRPCHIYQKNWTLIDP